VVPAQAWPKFPKKRVFGKKDQEFIAERRLHMEAYFNEIFAEKRTDTLTSRRIMGELYTYFREVARTDSDKAKVKSLIDVTMTSNNTLSVKNE
jgi:hypothetical protein